MQNSLQRQNNFKLNSRWLLAGLLLLVGAALFPYGLIPFGRILSFSPALRHEMYHLFATWQAHVIGHAALFFVLGTAVLLAFPALLKRPKLYFGIILLLGVLQEFFQIVGFKHRGVVFDDIFDVAVDLTGAFVAFLLLRLYQKSMASLAANKVNEVIS